MSKRKRLFSLLLIAVFVLSLTLISPFTVSAIGYDMAETGAKSGKTGDCTWSLNGTVLTISGNGRMGSYDNWDGTDIAPWQNSDITEVKINSGVTTIGKCAFQNCSLLKKVTIPNTVIGIGISAFDYCFSLSNVNIPDSVTVIGDSAFYYCQSLTNVTIPNTVTSIGNWAFAGCINLAKVTIGSSVSRIGESAFTYCSNLSNVIIPDSVKSIGSEAFYDCEKLKSVTLPASVTAIGSNAFGYYHDYDFGAYIKLSGFTINGYNNTEAKRYANENGFKFIALKPIVLGDVDGDEEIEIRDATWIQRHCASISIPFSLNKKSADVDGNGTVNVIDATTIQRYLANLKTDYPIGKTIL